MHTDTAPDYAMTSPGIGSRSNFMGLLLALVAALALSGCGSSGGGGDAPVAAADDCDAANADCGTVIIGLTDAEGDFLRYEVNVVALTLYKTNGTRVDTLPNSSRLDFAQYTDLTEFLTAATVPSGVYVKGILRLDYSQADVLVEAADGTPVPATVVDETGAPLEIEDIEVVLDDRRALIVRRGLPSLLVVDFDLAASHSVDLGTDPATATAEPFIVAEIEPVDSKDMRVRGPLVSVDEAESSYTVGVRPYHLRDGEFGRAVVHTTGDTIFEIDGENHVGAEGLAALAATGPRTLTVALGTLDVGDRQYTASQVYAGSSVPGTRHDAVRGNVVAREGDVLTIRGATVIRRNGSIVFNDNVAVQLGPETRVRIAGQGDENPGLERISVGQRVWVFGEVTNATVGELAMNASPGLVRLLLTHLAGTVNANGLGWLDMDLQSIDRRRVNIFDFTGTGQSAEQDADPANYEVGTGDLNVPSYEPGTPVKVYGFSNSFGMAPPDFLGSTVFGVADVRARLAIGWGESGTTAPFLSTGPDGLVLDLENEDIGLFHHLDFAGIRVDLLALGSNTAIVPASEGRTMFAIAEGRTIQVFSDFTDFVEALGTRLDGSRAARFLFAQGGFDRGQNILSANKICIRLD